jgi:hypothetical protein
VLSEFLKGLPLVEMAPDYITVKHAGGVVAHMLSSSKGEYAMYLDGNGPADVTFSLPAGTYEYSWVEVATGKRSEAVEFVHSGGEKMLETPAFKNGIAMRMRRR